MKTKVFFTTLLVIILALASCRKDEGSSDNNGETETRSFFIRIGKSGAKTRAEGSDMSSAEVTFSTGYLIFTTGDEIGHVLRIVAGTPGEDEVTVESLEEGYVINEIPASTKNVYLYGNLGGSISDIATEAVKGGSLADVEALVWELDDIQNEDNDVSDVPVYGKGDVLPGVLDPSRLESSFDVYPVGARLQIGEIDCTDTRVGELLLAGIYINGFYHSMEANITVQSANIVNNGIDKTKYPETGYSDYATMSDILSVAVDISDGIATPVTEDGYWAYNFFPAEMPHIVLHFTSLKVNGQDDLVDQYATVAKYSTSAQGGSGNELTIAEPGNIYTLNIIITDYETQIADLPESGSTVVGYVEINILDWESTVIYPEW